jgi:hypothetical protein
MGGWSSLITSSGPYRFMEAAARSVGLSFPCGYSVNSPHSDQRDGVDSRVAPYSRMKHRLTIWRGTYAKMTGDQSFRVRRRLRRHVRVIVHR